ncbi:hypothetical protein [Streptomyces sp. cg35]|uniref:hypothetical protein n=1 Tax=Streptomyces sp. cg35 TaxID=3421650 RepID=UPI003D165D75
MRRTTTHTAKLLLATSALLATAGVTVTGCGSTQPGGNPSKNPQTRARQVADAWNGSDAAAQWRHGYYPMGDVTQLPEGGPRDEADEWAYDTGNFDLVGDLPATPSPPKRAQVTWQNDVSLALPLLSARQTYRQLDRNSSPRRHLTVTGAVLGTMPVPTSHGTATVPAWLFTVKGYDTPLERAAVAPSKLPAAPIAPADDWPTDVLAPLDGLTSVADDGRSLIVMATHGACDDGPAVEALQTTDSVVLAASTVGADDGNCTSNLLIKKITVKLDDPVGERIILDASTGSPVPFSDRPKTSPTWS